MTRNIFVTLILDINLGNHHVSSFRIVRVQRSFTRETQSSFSLCLSIIIPKMSFKCCVLFLLFCILSSVLLTEAGTIHSSLGSGETNRGWKPGGKRGLDCLQLQSEALFTILEVVKDEVQKISSCERFHFDEKTAW
ncbi:uncharacterized protein TNCV_4683111 [Trichonephila clavipes]|nr:uncharacterized protein TNCV_4683111 [Trichonephila clavipes]